MLELCILATLVVLAAAITVRRALASCTSHGSCRDCAADPKCPLATITRRSSSIPTALAVASMALHPLGLGAQTGPDLDRDRERPTSAADQLTAEVSSSPRAADTGDTHEPFGDALLGTLGGLRPWLAEHGMALEIQSLDEGLSGGQRGGGVPAEQHYAGLTDVVFTVDTAAAGWWSGGEIVVDLQNVRGDDPSASVGDIQGVSNIVGPSGTRLAEYYLDQSTGDGSLSFKLGKQDANADFVVSDGGGEFLNSSFGLVPTVPLPTYPAPALGVMTRWRASEHLLLKAGVWDGASEVGSGCLDTALDGSGGYVAAAGLELGVAPNNLDGTYRLGAWHHSEVRIGASVKDAGDDIVGSADGLYLSADQSVWSDGIRRLAVFAQAGWAESDRSTISRYAGGGLTLHAPLSGRPDDVAGLALAHAELGYADRPSPDCDTETVIELFYRISVTPWLDIQPDLQLVDDPNGATGQAWVFGLRTSMRL